MLPECVLCPSLRVLAEIVGGKLGRLSEEGAELWKEADKVSHGLQRCKNVYCGKWALTSDLAWNAVSPFKAAIDMFGVRWWSKWVEDVVIAPLGDRISVQSWSMFVKAHKAP